MTVNTEGLKKAEHSGLGDSVCLPSGKTKAHLMLLSQHSSFPQTDVNKQCNHRIQMKQVSFPCMWYNTVGKEENKSNALKASRMQMENKRTNQML